jgi:hypothetical protein
MLYVQRKAGRSKRLCYLMRTMQVPMAASMVQARQWAQGRYLRLTHTHNCKCITISIGTQI